MDRREGEERRRKGSSGSKFCICSRRNGTAKQALPARAGIPVRVPARSADKIIQSTHNRKDSERGIYTRRNGFPRFTGVCTRTHLQADR